MTVWTSLGRRILGRSRTADDPAPAPTDVAPVAEAVAPAPDPGRPTGPALVERLRAAADPGSSTLDGLTAAIREIDDPAHHIDEAAYWNLYRARSLLSYVVWDHFAAAAAAHYRARHGAGEAPLERTGVLDGQLEEAELAALRTAFDQSPVGAYEGHDFADHYMFNPVVQGDAETRFNAFASYRRADERMIAALREFLRGRQASLERTMGHCWTVSAVKLVSLAPLTDGFGPHMWHVDSHPACMKKLMIYLGRTGPEAGSTEFELRGGGACEIAGPPGRWVLFENARVRHRGLPPRSEPRPVIELTFMPALETDLGLVDPGLNAGWPWFPPVPGAPGDAGYLAGQAVLHRLLLRSARLASEVGDVKAASLGVDNIL
jgi:hypothetical protein